MNTGPRCPEPTSLPPQTREPIVLVKTHYRFTPFLTPPRAAVRLAALPKEKP